MHQNEIAELVGALAPLVGDFVKKAIEPLQARNVALEARLADLEKRQPEKGEPGEPGKDAAIDPDQLEAALLLIVQEKSSMFRGDTGAPGTDGADADPAVIARMVGEAIAALPPAKDGKDVDATEVAALVERAVAALPPAKDGADADPAVIERMVMVEVEKAVSNLPVIDPVGLAGALIDRDGHLVVTLSDGATKALGLVVGKDGVDVDMDAIAMRIKAEVAALPKSKDGTDGLGFDDMDVVDVEGDCILRFARGETVKDFRLPITTYRGVWAEKAYKKGCGVTWAGSYWIAQRDTASKPDTPDSGWQLAVKRGRDGKAGDPGKPGLQGPKGDKGERGFAGRNA